MGRRHSYGATRDRWNFVASLGLGIAAPLEHGPEAGKTKASGPILYSKNALDIAMEQR